MIDFTYLDGMFSDLIYDIEDLEIDDKISEETKEELIDQIEKIKDEIGDDTESSGYTNGVRG